MRTPVPAPGVRVREALAEAADAGVALGRAHSVPPIAVDNAADATFAALFNARRAADRASRKRRRKEPKVEGEAGRRGRMSGGGAWTTSRRRGWPRCARSGSRPCSMS